MSATFDIQSAQLILVGRTMPDATWRMAAHAHSYWEFIYFLHGCGRIETPYSTLRAQPFFLAIYPPGLSHAELTDPLDPEETIYFGVDVAGMVPPDAKLLLSDPKGELGWLAERLLEETAVYGLTPLAHTYVRAFLYLVERLWMERPAPRPDVVETTLQYLHGNFTRAINLTVLATVARVSATHLAHRFRSRMGISPMRYLQQLRVEAGKRLLSTTDLSIQDVARRIGFDDPLYFSRILKRQTGCSPLNFRKQSINTTKSIQNTISSIPPPRG